jgi:hypothetical protein
MLFQNISRERKKADEALKRAKGEPALELEKGDLKAIIIAAFITLAPIMLIFAGGIALAFWLLIGRF